jgi:hypothetical protein
VFDTKREAVAATTLWLGVIAALVYGLGLL